MTQYRNTVEHIDLKGKLDSMTHEESLKALVDAEFLLQIGGTVEIEGVDLEELCRARSSNYITSAEFYEVYNGSKELMSIHDRLEQVVAAKLTPKIKRLANLRYYIKANRV